MVNGKLIRDESAVEDLRALKQNVAIDLIIIQASMEQAFELTRLTRLKDTSDNIFTLDRQSSEFTEPYNDALLDVTEHGKT